MNPHAGPRLTAVTTGYDAAGRPVSVSDEGDTATSSDDLCTTTTYTENLTARIRDTVARTRTVAAACGAKAVLPAAMVAASQTYYDGATSLATAPTRGNPTRTTRADTWTGKSFSYVTDATTSYDALGRVTAVTDAASHTTSTSYTPSAALPATSSTVTNAAGQATTISYDPAFGPTRISDPNGNVTVGGYDALGRVVSVWGPGRNPATQTPSVAYAYKITGTSVNAVTTTTLAHDELTVASTALYDGLLRPVQTQTSAPMSSGLGSVITTSLYDSRGLVAKTLGPFAIAATPSASMAVPAQLTAVPTAHECTYDGAGRVTTDLLKINDIAKWSTTTTYYGIATTVTPPAGATTTTTVVDARGRTSQLVQATGAPAPDVTSYTYTPAGNLATVTDPTGTQRTYSYDLQGNLTRSTSPDRGPTTSTYDRVGNLVTSTDARGTTLWRGYDVLNRQTQLRLNGSTGTQLAGWTYDTAPAGRGLPATAARYDNGNAFTSEITGYTPTGQPTGTKITIPAVEGLLAGSYVTTNTYTSSGRPASYRPVPAPGLPAEETLHYYYDNQDNLTDLEATGGAILTGTRRNAYGNILQYELGTTAGNLAHVRQTYQNGTQRLASTVLRRDAAALAYDANITYSYTDSGALTTIRDSASPGGGDRQCFQCDALQRLTEAWAQPGASGSCAATPATEVLGGVAPYWTTYGYDSAGNRLTG